jgi:hypothetical protein
MSIDLGGINGNILVEGDFIQEGGQLNLASGTGDNTILRVMGDLYQSSESVITETSSGIPTLELNGQRMQEIAMAGRIINQVGFRMNNAAGSTLRLPLKIPWKLELDQGSISSSTSALLILDTICTINIDSSKLTGAHIDGPLRKLGLNQEDHFLFPVGKDGNLRWLELKNATGNFTVEYVHQNPVSLGSSVGPGLDHISKIEYWTVMKDGSASNQGKIELSFASSQSGLVSDPDYLNVARFQISEWTDAGHSAITGNFQQGSVLSQNTDFSAQDYTLGSVLPFENPLPLTSIVLEIKEKADKPVFNWVIKTDEKPDHFNLYEKTNGRSISIARINAVDGQFDYSWTDNKPINAGIHFFMASMVDVVGNEYFGMIVPYKKEEDAVRLNWVFAGNDLGQNQILIHSPNPDLWNYDIISVEGRVVKKGNLSIGNGLTRFSTGLELMSKGKYVFRAVDSRGNVYVLAIEKI